MQFKVQTLLFAFASLAAAGRHDPTDIPTQMKAISQEFREYVSDIFEDGDTDLERAAKRFNHVAADLKKLDDTVEKSLQEYSYGEICYELSDNAQIFRDKLDDMDFAHREDGYAKGSEAEIHKSLTNMYNAYTGMTKAVLGQTKSCSVNAPSALVTEDLKNVNKSFEKVIKEYATK